MVRSREGREERVGVVGVLQKEGEGGSGRRCATEGRRGWEW